MNAYRLSPQAVADLEEITDYYLGKSPAAGQRVIRRIQVRCRYLARSPRTGGPRPHLGPGVRSAAVPPYVVFFRPDPAGVQILRVIHGSRDIDLSLFEG